MKYTIISIDDTRLEYKKVIRERVALPEVSVPAVNGKEVDIQHELEKRGVELKDVWHPTVGELGIWLSTMDCWTYTAESNEPLIVFEDDAIPTVKFQESLDNYISELPNDWHYLSLWVPENQYFDYLYDVKYDEDGRWEKVGDNRSEITSIHNYGAMRLSRVYQGYGNVATLYSPEGAAILEAHAKIYGITGPIDCWIHDRAHTKIVNGFAPKPRWAKAVTYDWAAETTVHKTERV